MKKYKLIISSILIGTSISFFSCEKDDSTADISKVTTYPVITILGDEIVTVQLGSTYTDAGATAADPITGESMNVEVTNNVDENTPGQYTVDYLSINADNFPVSASRIVNVIDTTTIYKNVEGTYKEAVSGTETTVTEISTGYYQMGEADGRLTNPVPVSLLNTQGRSLLINGSTVYGPIEGTGTIRTAITSPPRTVQTGDTLRLPLEFTAFGLVRTRNWIKQ